MKRKILEFKNFKPITKFLKKFNLKSFVNKNKIQSYMNFFELNYLLKEIPEDRIISKNKRYLIQVKKNEKKIIKTINQIKNRKIIKRKFFGKGNSAKKIEALLLSSKIWNISKQKNFIDLI